MGKTQLLRSSDGPQCAVYVGAGLGQPLGGVLYSTLGLVTLFAPAEGRLAKHASRDSAVAGTSTDQSCDRCMRVAAVWSVCFL